MKVGDLVKPKSKWDSNFQKKKSNYGVVVEIEENFFKTYNDYIEDRLTIYWSHGERTQEPDSYVEKINV
jgi:hypothetical protein